jgi:hypothetical protein
MQFSQKMNRLLMHLANFGGINNFASLPYKTFTIVMFYCCVVNWYMIMILEHLSIFASVTTSLLHSK